MPFKHTTVAFPKGQITTQIDLDALIVKHTQGTVKFNGLLLDLPFGKRGATELRTTAKTYGARWDGQEWTISAGKYPTLSTGGGLTWLLGNAVIAGIKTRTYTPWVWDGRPVDIALDLPFEDRNIAKQHGAKWDPSALRWYLPAALMSQTKIAHDLIDSLNKAEAIDGEIDPATGKVVAQANIGQAPLTPRGVTPPPATTHPSDAVRASVDAILAGVDRTLVPDAAVSLIEAEYLGDAVHSLRHEAGEVSVVLLPLHTDRVVIVHWKRGIDATMVPTLCHSGAATMAGLVRDDSARAVITDRATSRKVYETLANQFGYKPVVAA